ncbi:membrane protein insertase YidC [Micrococcales bacterium 31B]|nr:membrane protein insertase YidC [Micrococcales bacterium 31B]
MLDTIFYPIEWAIAFIMVMAHKLLTLIGLDSAGGATWALSIVGLVVVVRVLLIPLFVRQIKAQRGMQLIQPEMKKIQDKYKGKTDPASRQAMSQETMELYRRTGTNPFSSCLPLLLQTPIFIGLYRVLYYQIPQHAQGGIHEGDFGYLTMRLATEAHNAVLFGAKFSDTFMQATAGNPSRVLAVILIIAMCATLFITQRQISMKNMPPSALEGPMGQTQKIMLYMLPAIMGITGFNFPIGVLLYWTVSNLWTLGQQYYVIRNSPTPGSEAEEKYRERLNAKRVRKGLPTLEEEASAARLAAAAEKPQGQREQPKRNQPKKSAPKAKRTQGPDGKPLNQATPSSPQSPNSGSAVESPGNQSKGQASGNQSKGQNPGNPSPKKPRNKK